VQQLERPPDQPPTLGMGYQPPQAISGAARAIAFLRRSSIGALAMVGGVMVLQAVLPPNLKPATLLGSFEGQLTVARLGSERDAQRQTAETLANAQAAPAANWQMEQQVLATQQAAEAQAMQGEASVAVVADLTCLLSGAVAAFGDRPSENLAHDMRGTCGVGTQIRRGMNAELADAARNGSAIMQRATPEGGFAPVAVPPR
jgi:hypothetical protein